MANQNEHLETLNEIRSLMERSSRFISLSGLSGVTAGIIALIGATVAYFYMDATLFWERQTYLNYAYGREKWGLSFIEFFILDAGIVFTLAIGCAIFFTTRNAKRNNQKIWSKTSQLLLMNLMIPLGAGGIYCLILLNYNLFYLVAPTTLIFYGLALINASKYTLREIRFLGISEVVLGLIAAYFWGFGLLFWAIGFGVLHIFYGIMMYLRYERK